MTFKRKQSSIFIVFNFQLLILLTITFSFSVVHSQSSNLDEFYTSSLYKKLKPMQALECYRCTTEVPVKCDVAPDDFTHAMVTGVNIDELSELLFGLDDDEDEENFKNEEDVIAFAKKLAAIETNPCKIITSKVMKLVESDDNTLLPIFLNLKGKDDNTKYEELREVISSIRFQKREFSDWVAVEVQLHAGEDPFSFIISDYDQDFASILHDSFYYTAL